MTDRLTAEIERLASLPHFAHAERSELEELAARNLAWRAEREYEEKRAADAIAARRCLVTLAKIAHAAGCAVRASRRDGRVSSYYVETPAGRVRISDHEIPATAERHSRAEYSGRAFYDGYDGVQIIIDRPRSVTWLRRALILASAGRSVG